jgi:hypothetical protein
VNEAMRWTEEVCSISFCDSDAIYLSLAHKLFIMGIVLIFFIIKKVRFLVRPITILPDALDAIFIVVLYGLLILFCQLGLEQIFLRIFLGRLTHLWRDLRRDGDGQLGEALLGIEARKELRGRSAGV